MVTIEQTPPRARPRRSDSVFFPLMAITMALVVFAGFAPTYYLKYQFNGPPLSLLKMIHGAAFTAWITLLVTQTGLIASNRRDLHRPLGVAGAGLAGLMVVLGTMLAIDALRRGFVPPGAPPSPAAFFAVPMGDMAAFIAMVSLGVINRKRMDYHKRYMLLATAAIIDAAVARIPLAIIQQAALPMSFLVSDLFILAVALYDLAIKRRVHPATIWSGVIIIGSQALRVWIGGTQIWHDFAASLL
jgi:hypothetical protein